MSEITCSCEKSFEADLPELVDLSEHPEALEQILAGSFLSFPCPHCGLTVKPEYPLAVTDTQKGLDIYLIPEVERNRFLAGLGDYPQHDSVVIGFTELAERLRVISAGMSVEAIEIVKYYLLVKAGDQARIAFTGIEDDQLVFEISGIRDDEIAVARLPRDLYERAVSDLDTKRAEEPFDTILEPPYISIAKIELEQEV